MQNIKNVNTRKPKKKCYVNKTISLESNCVLKRPLNAVSNTWTKTVKK